MHTRTTRSKLPKLSSLEGLGKRKNCLPPSGFLSLFVFLGSYLPFSPWRFFRCISPITDTSLW